MSMKMISSMTGATAAQAVENKQEVINKNLSNK